MLPKTEDIHTIHFFERFGADCIAPLVAAFSEWLRASSERDRLTHLLFMSRDGFLLQKAYQALTPSDSLLPNTYMYASRRLLNIPAIEHFDAATLKSLTGDKPIMPVGDYLLRIGLEPSQYTRNIREAGFTSPDSLIKTSGDMQRLKCLLKRLEPEFLEIMRPEREKMLHYLDSLGLNKKDRRIGLIDIGWHGSMQRSLQHLLGEQKNTYYYYFGLHKRRHLRCHTTDHTSAFLNESVEPKLYAQTVRQCMELFEISFSEPVGTLIRLHKDTQGVFTPVYSPVVPNAHFVSAVTALQNGALQNLAAFRGVAIATALQPIKRVLNNPTLFEATALGELRHHEGIADIGTSAPLAKLKSCRTKYLRHPIHLFFDWHRSFWPKGFAVLYGSHSKMPR